MVARIYLWICAILFVGLGVALMFWPAEILKGVEVSFVTPTAFADIRADYGGCIFGLGLFLVYCSTRQQLVRLGLFCTGMTFSGYLLGRLISLGIDGMPKQIIFVLIIFELVAALIAFAMMPLAPAGAMGSTANAARSQSD